MKMFVNHRLVEESEGLIPVSDRGFLYGDGLFETIPFANRRFFRWEWHLERLRSGLELLHFEGPEKDLLREAETLLDANSVKEGLLRLVISRGSGPRGYSIPQESRPTVVMSLRPAPMALPCHIPSWRLTTTSVVLPAGATWTSVKHTNRLPNILARHEAEASGADEGLILNTRGQLAEGAASNIFWLEDGRVVTPSLDDGALAGVTRRVVLELCRDLGLAVDEGSAAPDVLRSAQGVFSTLSSLGVVEAIALDGRDLRRSQLTRVLAERYWQLLAAETAR
jgi:aminodeoxychorismate lyase